MLWDCSVPTLKWRSAQAQGKNLKHKEDDKLPSLSNAIKSTAEGKFALSFQIISQKDLFHLLLTLWHSAIIFGQMLICKMPVRGREGMKYFWKPWQAQQEQGLATEQVKEPVMLAESKQGCFSHIRPYSFSFPEAMLLAAQ